jgi:hypothetical protein
MPVKLPAPDLGTEEQPGPKSADTAAADPAGAEAGAEEAGAGDAGAPAGLADEPELHAVADSATQARPQAASRRYFMGFLLYGG